MMWVAWGRGLPAAAAAWLWTAGRWWPCWEAAAVLPGPGAAAQHTTHAQPSAAARQAHVLANTETKRAKFIEIIQLIMQHRILIITYF